MRLRIADYAFGRVTIGGRRFTSDVIVYPDGHIQDNWWRSRGHHLILEDIPRVLEATPDLLLIGTGASGRMQVSEDVKAQCSKRRIALEIYPTAEAVARFNDAAASGMAVAACFHLTC